jgi:Holliday junction resolvase RusA-like endonuclease
MRKQRRTEQRGQTQKQSPSDFGTSFIIPGTVRSKKNSKQIIFAGRYPRLIPSKAHRKWEREFQSELKAECLKRGIKPTEKPVAVSAKFFWKGPEPDLSGLCESLADACEGILWNDDKQIRSWDGSRKYHDKENPRVEFCVRFFEEE